MKRHGPAFQRGLAVVAVAALALTALASSAQTSLANAASGADAATHVAWVPPSPWALYLVPLFVLLASVVAIWKIAAALGPDDWSLAIALSEDVMLPVYKDAVPATGSAPAVPRTPMLDNDGKPVLAPVMQASSSRLIALMGMMAILFLFLGFGVFAIFEFGATGTLPQSMDRVATFLTSGLTLFAPYLVNKFAAVFKPAPGK